jgi:hypothetical protein
MKVSHGEGLASHIGPESCVCDRKVIGEALTGENAGRVLSRERMRRSGTLLIKHTNLNSLSSSNLLGII